MTEWTWQAETPPPVELPPGYAWRWDSGSDDWDVVDDKGTVVGFVQVPNADEPLSVCRILANELRRSHDLQ